MGSQSCLICSCSTLAAALQNATSTMRPRVGLAPRPVGALDWSQLPCVRALVHAGGTELLQHVGSAPQPHEPKTQHAQPVVAASTLATGPERPNEHPLMAPAAPWGFTAARAAAARPWRQH